MKGAKITTTRHVNPGRRIDQQGPRQQIQPVFPTGCRTPLAQQTAGIECQPVRADGSSYQGGTVNQDFITDSKAVKAGQTSLAEDTDLGEGIDAAERQPTSRGRGQITFGRIDTQTGDVVVDDREVSILCCIRGKTQPLQGARLPTDPRSCQGIGCDIRHHTTSHGAEWSRTFTTVHRAVIHDQMISAKRC